MSAQKKRYKVINRISQPIQLITGETIWENKFIITEVKTEQIENLEKRGFVTVRQV